MMIHANMSKDKLESLIRGSPIAVAEESHGFSMDVSATRNGSFVRILARDDEILDMVLRGFLSPLVSPLEVLS